MPKAFYPFEANRTIGLANKNPIMWGDSFAAAAGGSKSVIFPTDSVSTANQASNSYPYPFPSSAVQAAKSGDFNLVVQPDSDKSGDKPKGGLSLPGIDFGQIATGGFGNKNDETGRYFNFPFEDTIINLGKRAGGYLLGILLVGLGIWAVLRG